MESVAPNLPPYPWARDKLYRYEPRSSRLERLQISPRTDLLGLPLDHQNLFEQRWRNFLRARVRPWIKDHSIPGVMIYPGVGMLVSVIEAAHELCRQQDIGLLGIELVDVHSIPVDGAVETLLRIRVPQGREDRPRVYKFASTVSDKPWIENYVGSFYIVLDSIAGLLDEDSILLDWKARLEMLADIKSRTSTKVGIPKLYNELRRTSMKWGDSFRNLASITAAIDGSGCYASVRFRTVSSGSLLLPNF
ncbi:hypothetical protein SLS53_007149 [Cytospora paraplurivora]|uniref:PKS/mFAS DH domain-containing protein n=1 Tax=Cytospora paraplurivora TaxID=2898453 RepID=A0AAN9U138_9PEZI